MEIADRETKTSGGLETPGRRVHFYRGRRKWIIGREQKGTPVLSTMIGSVRGSGEDIMPFEDIGFGGMGFDVWRGIFGDGFIFTG